APILGGSIAGTVALAPWLIRNAVASGNRGFPLAPGLPKSGHWSDEQLARYAGGHAFDGGLADRLALLFSPERGLLHPQWAPTLLPFMLGAIAAGILWPRTRRPAALLAGGIGAGLVGWLLLTHLQSRFLIPLAA